MPSINGLRLDLLERGSNDCSLVSELVADLQPGIVVDAEFRAMVGLPMVEYLLFVDPDTGTPHWVEGSYDARPPGPVWLRVAVSSNG